MSRSVKAVIGASASFFFGLSLSAGIVHIDFENFVDTNGNTVDLRDNNRITNQYEEAYGLTFDSVTFTQYGSSYYNVRSKQFGLSIYDTTGPNANDNDLEAPYSNISAFDNPDRANNPYKDGFGNVLVLQENNSTHEFGADDNAAGGIIKMRWKEAVSLTELIFLDIGDNNENSFGLNFTFYYANGTKDTQSRVYGNGADSITLFEPTTSSWLDQKGKNITGLDVKYKASGALASLSFAPIPEPSQILLIGTGMCVLFLGSSRRRRSSKKIAVVA